MKKYYLKTLLVLLYIIGSFQTKATNYTFSGIGNWSDATLWSPSYPGIILQNAADNYYILGGCTLNVNLTNNSNIYIGKMDLSGQQTDGIFNINSTSTLSNISGRLNLQTDNSTLNIYGIVNNDSSSVIEPIQGWGYITAKTNIYATGFIYNDGIVSLHNLNVDGHLYNSNSIIKGTIGVHNYNLGCDINNKSTGTWFIDFSGNTSNPTTININGDFINDGIFTNKDNILLNKYFLNNNTVNNYGSFTVNGNFENQNTVQNTGSFNLNGGIYSGGYGTLNGIFISNSGIVTPKISGSIAFSKLLMNNTNIQSYANTTVKIDIENNLSYGNISHTNSNYDISGSIIDVTTLSTYTPTIGDAFNVMTGNVMTGFLSAVVKLNNSIIDPNTTPWNVNQVGSNLQLKYVGYPLNLNDIKGKLELIQENNIISFTLNDFSNKIMIFNLDGKLIQNFVPKIGLNKIDISNLINGIYIIKINESSFKFIK